MKSIFEETIERKNTDSVKWDYARSSGIPFWIADSDYQTCPSIIDDLLKRVKHGAFGYTDESDSLKQVVANWYLKRYHISTDFNWVSFNRGVIEAIKHAIDVLTVENDLIVIQPPVYHMFKKTIEIRKRRVVNAPLRYEDGNYLIDYLQLEKAFALGAKVFLFCSPHNPVGRVWRKDELRKIVDLAQKYQVYIISDEIHSDIMINGHTFVSMLQFEDIYDRLIVCNAPSKAFNVAGLGISYQIIPGDNLRQKFTDNISRLCANSPSLLGYTALESAYTKGEKWLFEQSIHLTKNYHYLKEYLLQKLPLVKVVPLEGTYLVWLDLRYLQRNSHELCQHFDQAGIILSDGLDFGIEGDGFMRMNIATSLSNIKEGLKLLFAAIKELENAAR